MRLDSQIDESLFKPTDNVVATVLTPEPLEFEPVTQLEILEDHAMRLIKAGETKKGRAILNALYQDGDYWAGNTLAYGLQAGWFGRKEYKKAIKILLDCAENGDACAMNNLAFSYSRGLGVKKDIALTIHWYEKAADAGYLEAKLNLALELLYAPGELRDYARALAIVTAPEMDGVADAFNTLGRIYEEGYGVPVDLRKAYECYKKAVEIGGCPTAKHNLERFVLPKK